MVFSVLTTVDISVYSWLSITRYLSTVSNSPSPFVGTRCVSVTMSSDSHWDLLSLCSLEAHPHTTGLDSGLVWVPVRMWSCSSVKLKVFMKG